MAAAGVGKTAAPKISQMGAPLGLAAVLQLDFLLLAAPAAKMLPALTGPPTVVEGVVEPEHLTLIRQLIRQFVPRRAEAAAMVW